MRERSCAGGGGLVSRSPLDAARATRRPPRPPLTLSERELRAHPNAVPVTDALNQAQQALRDAAELWEGVCTTPDASVPLETARAARQALRTAGAALEQAAALLTAWR